MENPWIQIGVWGDSIVHGGCDPVMGGWVNRLRLYLWSRGMGDHVFNLGLGGNNSTDVLNRIEPELRARRVQVDHVMIGVGVNDLLHPTQPMPLEVFAQNLRDIIAIVRTLGKSPHLLSMIPIQKDPEKWVAYNAIMERVAADTGAGWIDLRNCLIASDLPDLVHPDAKGHEKVFQAVKDHLIRVGIIPEE